jgi:hypothetical protein
MDLTNPKALKKLAETCRKAGITSFKGFGVEFTLGDIPPTKVVNRRTKQTEPLSTFESAVKRYQSEQPAMIRIDEEKQADTPSEEDMLFWSVGPEQEAS